MALSDPQSVIRKLMVRSTLVIAMAAMIVGPGGCKRGRGLPVDSIAAPFANVLSSEVTPSTHSIDLDTTVVPPGTHGHPPAVILTVGAIRLPISADARFADSAQRLLPPPGVLPTTDPHDAAHGDKTLCYSFPGGFLTIYDSDFGMNGIRLTRGAPSRSARCPVLAVVPAVLVGATMLTLESPLSGINDTTFPGFAPPNGGRGQSLTREWWYVERRARGQVACISENISIEVVARNAVLSQLEIWKSAEGWPSRSRAKTGAPTDSVWSCWS
jgi:hypothetical protein